MTTPRRTPEEAAASILVFCGRDPEHSPVTLDAVAAAIAADRQAGEAQLAEARAEVARLRGALEWVRDHEDHDEYCDGCVYRKRYVERVLAETT